MSPYRSRLLIAYGNFIFRYRNTVFPVALAVLVLAFPPKPGVHFPYYPWTDLAALLVALAGETLRILTVGLDYIKRGGMNRRVYADKLVTTGLFAHSRNPLYVGNVMIALALLTIPNSAAMLAIGAVLVLVTYMAIVAAEENHLRATFGDAYEDYCRDVNRWLPDLRGLGATVGSMAFNWRRVLLKESSSFYGWIAAAFVLDGIESRFSLADPAFVMFLSIFVVGTLAFVTIRILKSTRRLQL